MKVCASISIALALIGTVAVPASTAAIREEFRGRFSRDCGNGQTCHLDIDDMKSKTTLEITFSVEGKGKPCQWTVHGVFDKGLDGPVARDPYGNYYFYLTRQADGRLYSSGTMLQICMQLPTDQYFTSDAQTLIEYRSVYDHNGSLTDVDPEGGTILYRKPSKRMSATVKSGEVLFKAGAPWNPYDDKALVRGTAYAFKSGCDPAPYEVVGTQEGWHTLVLRGPAPVREKNGCRVIGYRMNGNSTLKFVSLGD